MLRTAPCISMLNCLDLKQTSADNGVAYFTVASFAEQLETLQWSETTSNYNSKFLEGNCFWRETLFGPSPLISPIFTFFVPVRSPYAVTSQYFEAYCLLRRVSV